MIDELLLTGFVEGHCLLVGFPVLPKTLLVSTLAKTLDLAFSRIQFTPDLMPSDITGTDVIQEDKVTRERAFKFIQGPLFANVVLADEINRTPPKTQAALLQAMQERKVTASEARLTRCLRRFFGGTLKTRSSKKERIRCPKPQLDRFYFRSTSAIHVWPNKN